jgi:hypothetical protein
MYSSIPVFEVFVTIKQTTHVVMRRYDTDFVNATQILKVAGIDKGISIPIH